MFYDVAIIGAGPAGLSALINLSRVGLKIILFESKIPGGKMLKTKNIDNYLGFKKISGSKLSKKMFSHAKKYNFFYFNEKIINIIDKKKYFLLKTRNNKKYKTFIIIVATGKKEKNLNLKNEKKLIGSGISYCAICDSFFLKNKIAVIIGGGDSAFKESLYLSNFLKKIFIVIRKNKPRANKILQKQVKKNNKIKLYNNLKPFKYVIKNNKIVAIKFKNFNNKIKTIKCDCVFLYIGGSPIINFLKKINILKNKNDYILVNKKFETIKKRIYAIGDVIQKDLYQISTAVSDGAIAANNIINYISKKNNFKSFKKNKKML